MAGISRVSRMGSHSWTGTVTDTTTTTSLSSFPGYLINGAVGAIVALGSTDTGVTVDLRYQISEDNSTWYPAGSASGDNEIISDMTSSGGIDSDGKYSAHPNFIPAKYYRLQLITAGGAGGTYTYTVIVHIF